MREICIDTTLAEQRSEARIVSVGIRQDGRHSRDAVLIERRREAESSGIGGLGEAWLGDAIDTEVADPECVRSGGVRVLQAIVVDIGGEVHAVIKNIVKEDDGRAATAMQIAVPHIQPRSFTEVLVHLNVELHAVVARQNDIAIVVRTNSWVAGLIRFRVIIDELLTDGIDFRLRNFITGVSGTAAVYARGKGIEDLIQHEIAVGIEGVGIRKISAAFLRRRDGCDDVYGRLITHDFQVSEEEGAVLTYRAADGKAVLVALMIWNRSTIKEVPGVEGGALAVPPAATMQLVRARFHHRVHDSAAIVAVFGGEAVVLDLELLKSFYRGLVVDV